MLKEFINKTKEVKELKEEIKFLNKKIEENDDKVHDIYRSNSLRVRDLKAEMEDNLDEHERNIEKIKEDARKDVEKVELKIERIEEDTEFKLEQKEKRTKQFISDKEKEVEATKARLEVEANLKISETVQNFKEEKEEEISLLNEDNASLREEAASANAMASEMGNTINNLKDQVKGYREIISELQKLLPKVDMSKFNINVDVPASDVTVNTNCKAKK